MIPSYPQSTELQLEDRLFLHPKFQQLTEGISEFTFANLYLFRETHHYKVTKLADGLVIITGHDDKKPFFMSPFGLPAQETLKELMQHYGSMKCVSQELADELGNTSYIIQEDRDNFDYLYLRKDLSELTGRKFSRKRNQIKAFIKNFTYEGRPLLDEYKNDAITVLEEWREKREDPGDYVAAREAIEYMEELQLCGGIYYTEGKPIAYSLGEELMGGQSFAIHFEKATVGYKGLWQFINQAFASILPEKYTYINREQDLGSEGLRDAKLSYQPVGFIKKYRVLLPS